MPRWFVLLCLLVFTFSGPPAVIAAGFEDLVYMTEQYPPYNYIEDGRVKGISVELLRAVWKRLGVAPQKIAVLPWARAYRNIQKHKNTVLFSMARTKAREKLFQWSCPISTNRLMLYARADAPFTISGFDDLEGRSVGVIRDDISHVLLLPYAEKARIEAVSDMLLNMRKLQHGRLDMAAYSEDSFPTFLKQNGFDPADYRPVMPLGQIETCFAFHREVDPELVAAFQKAFDAVAASGEKAAILKKYGRDI